MRNLKKKLNKSKRDYSNRDQSGKKNPFYGKRHSKEFGKIISESNRKRSGKNHHMWGKHHSKETILKMKTATHRHHVYLKQNSKEVKKLSISKHKQLHQRAYDFIYANYGKKGIDDYIKWFDERFGLKDEKS